MAEIAFPGPSFRVVRAFSSLVLWRAVPVDQLLGNDAVGILAAHELIQRVAVHTFSNGA